MLYLKTNSAIKAYNYTILSNYTFIGFLFNCLCKFKQHITSASLEKRGWSLTRICTPDAFVDLFSYSNDRI